MAYIFETTTGTLNEIITLAVAKKQLKMEDLGTFDDTIIQDCIDSAIQQAENYIESSIHRRTFKINADEWEQRKEYRKQKITAITKITVKNEAGNEEVFEGVALEEIAELLPIDKYASIINFKDFDNLPKLKKGITDAISIEITTGYTAQNVPKPIKQAIKLYLTENYEIRNNRPVKGINTAAEKLLSPYRYYPS